MARHMIIIIAYGQEVDGSQYTLTQLLQNILHRPYMPHESGTFDVCSSATLQQHRQAMPLHTYAKAAGTCHRRLLHFEALLCR